MIGKEAELMGLNFRRHFNRRGGQKVKEAGICGQVEGGIHIYLLGITKVTYRRNSTG